MPNQLSFFEKSNHDGETTIRTPARRADKETSQKAAASVDLNGNRELFFDTLKDWGGIPRTANEVAAKAIVIDGSKPIQAVFSKRETVRKRASSLVESGHIVECSARPCKITGKEVTTYEVKR